MCDLGDVAQKYRTWNIVFPRIKPFYGMEQFSQVLIGYGLNHWKPIPGTNPADVNVIMDKLKYIHILELLNVGFRFWPTLCIFKRADYSCDAILCSPRG